MRMIVTTPFSVIADVDDMRALRAEDETGAFGILPGHADFLTVLGISVISWRDAGGEEHHIAVSGGILSVRSGSLVEIAAHEAFAEDTLATLGTIVEEQFRRQTESEQESWIAAARLQYATIRSIERYIRVGRGTATPELLPTADDSGARAADMGDR